MLNVTPPVRPARRASPAARRSLAVFAASALSLFAAGSALATTPEGTVTVDTDGCDFTVTIDLAQAWPEIGWEVKAYASHWQDGKTVLDGLVKDDADGHVVVGPFTLPAGHYNVAVDNEPVDSSSIVEDFTLSCAAPTATASATATPSATASAGATASASATATASPTQTGEELPVEGTPGPTGEELGAVGVGAGITPPPTDTGVGSAVTATGLPGGLVTLLSVLTVSALAFAVSNRHLARARARSHERRGRH